MTDYRSHLSGLSHRKDEMLDLVIRWAEINSGTRNLPGLERMATEVQKEFSRLGGSMEALELPPMERVDSEGRVSEEPLGRAISITKRPESRFKVLLSIHMDTVYPPDHPFQTCSMLDGGRLRGPGVTDAKGGMVVMLEALHALENSPWAENLGWHVIITPDEEIGSPGSASILEEAGRHCQVGLVFEPALPDGSLVGARKGVGNFTVTVRGRAAHAGRDFEAGRNAISALARFVVEMEDLHSQDPGIIVNTGYIEGGGPVNVVPDWALCRFNIRVDGRVERDIVETNLHSLIAGFEEMDGLSVEVRGDFNRPPKPLEPRTVELFRLVADCGRDVGLSLQFKPSGGACDGNNLAAVGLPTVDSMGVRGDKIHSDEEFLHVESLHERAALTALVLMKLAAGEIPWEKSSTAGGISL